MSVLKVNKENFESVKNSEKKVLLDFYAEWCGPCRMVSPLVDEIANENPDLLVGKINVDEEPELAAAFGSKQDPAGMRWYLHTVLPLPAAESDRAPGRSHRT